MSVTIAIRTLLDDMADGQIFTTRDLNGLGSRAAIDQCLKRMVDGGVIQRLANGVFANGTKVPQITSTELAQIKAGAFHKEIYEHPETTAQRLGYVPRPQPKTRNPLVFATNGTGSTSFNSVFGRIHLKAVSARKRREDNDEVWEVLKALWHVGQRGITAKIREHIRRMWGRKCQPRLEAYSSSVPEWVLKEFPRDRQCAFDTIHLKLVPFAFERMIDEYHNTLASRQALADLQPGYSMFELPELDSDIEPASAFDASSHDSRASSEKCDCPDFAECICPLFTCSYCLTQPVRNRFSVAVA